MSAPNPLAIILPPPRYFAASVVMLLSVTHPLDLDAATVLLLMGIAALFLVLQGLIVRRVSKNILSSASENPGRKPHSFPFSPALSPHALHPAAPANQNRRDTAQTPSAPLNEPPISSARSPRSTFRTDGPPER